jgi:hypothetical protein
MVSRPTFVRVASTTVAAPRIQLVLTPRAHVARGRTAPLPTPSPQAAAEIRIRESSVLRERLERTVMRALRLERRVERVVRDRDPAAGARPRLTPISPTAGMSPRTLVFREGSPPGADALPAPEVTSPAAVDLPAPAPRTDVAAVADAVLRVLDRRIVAERERRGHV